MIRRTLRATLAATAFAIAGTAAAAPISLLVPVTYAEDSKVLNKTKDSCALEDKLAGAIGAEMHKAGGTAQTTTTPAGIVLRVTILGSRGIGGGGWTGSKTLSVNAALLKDGLSVRNRNFMRKSRGGLAGPFEGTCAILEGIAETLGQDIVAWSGAGTDANFDADADAAARRSAEAAASAAQ